MLTLCVSLVAEIELQKLQRQYRIMEGDRKAYSEESRILIGKQRYFYSRSIPVYNSSRKSNLRATIEKLRSDNEHLQDELKLLEKRNEDKRKNGLRSKKAESLGEQAGLVNISKASQSDSSPALSL